MAGKVQVTWVSENGRNATKLAVTCICDHSFDATTLLHAKKYPASITCKHCGTKLYLNKCDDHFDIWYGEKMESP